MISFSRPVDTGGGHYYAEYHCVDLYLQTQCTPRIFHEQALLHRIKILTALNLPFSEWTQAIPNARLCKALLDRITDRAHIIETGSDSYRFRRTVEKRQKKKRHRCRGRIGAPVQLELPLRPKRSALRAPQGYAPAPVEHHEDRDRRYAIDIKEERQLTINQGGAKLDDQKGPIQVDESTGSM
jgi:hypothetical protein